MASSTLHLDLFRDEIFGVTERIFLVRVYGIELPGFFLVLSLVSTLAFLWVHQRAGRAGLDQRKSMDLAVIAWAVGLLGARLFHVLYEAPAYYLADPGRFFEFNSGGFVFYGGILSGGLVTLILLLRWKFADWREWGDLCAPLLAFGHGLGRLGCQLAGCCYGKYCELPWALRDRHPVPLYLLFWDLGLMIALLGLERRPAGSFGRRPGDLLGLWAVISGVGRFLFEFLRDDFRGPSFFFSVSQWFSLILILAGCLILRRSLLQAAGLLRENAK